MCGNSEKDVYSFCFMYYFPQKHALSLSCMRYSFHEEVIEKMSKKAENCVE